MTDKEFQEEEKQFYSLATAFRQMKGLRDSLEKIQTEGCRIYTSLRTSIYNQDTSDVPELGKDAQAIKDLIAATIEKRLAIAEQVYKEKKKEIFQ